MGFFATSAHRFVQLFCRSSTNKSPQPRTCSPKPEAAGSIRVATTSPIFTVLLERAQAKPAGTVLTTCTVRGTSCYNRASDSLKVAASEAIPTKRTFESEIKECEVDLPVVTADLDSIKPVDSATTERVDERSPDLFHNDPGVSGLLESQSETSSETICASLDQISHSALSSVPDDLLSSKHAECEDASDSDEESLHHFINDIKDGNKFAPLQLRSNSSSNAGSDSECLDEEHPDEDLFEDKQEHSSSEPESSSDDSDPDAIDTENPRADWASIRALPKDLFHCALLQHLPNDHGVTVDDIKNTDEIEGGFNFVLIMEVTAGPHADQYVVKVPCTGTAARWQELDAYMWRNEACTMQYIRKHTTVPIPEVLGFSDSLSNVLGAPYIVMRRMSGLPSTRIWFDREEDGNDDLEYAYLPTEECKERRKAFLTTLVQAMAGLQTLSFDESGMLDFDKDGKHPDIGPVYICKPLNHFEGLKQQDMSTPACLNRYQPYSSSQKYFMDVLNEKWPRSLGEDYIAQQTNGRRHIVELVLASEPFFRSAKEGDSKETFVLRHDNLDFQNILCDADGTVTAIIDWDKCRAVPRCFGYSSLPKFLTPDWFPSFNPYNEVHMPWELDEYRRIYSDAMLEATGPDDDGRFTSKSPLYEAVHAALYGGTKGGSVRDVVHRILKNLPCARRFLEGNLLELLGEGWHQGEWKVNVEVMQLVAPGGEL